RRYPCRAAADSDSVQSTETRSRSGVQCNVGAVPGPSLPNQELSMKHRLTRAVLALVATAAMTAGTLATAQARPSSTDEPGPVDIPQRYLEQEIDWSTCSFDATVKQLYPDAPTTRCAEITVPMDWNDPDAHPDITLAIAHSEATGESQGLMTTNPGGPGGAGLTMSAALAITKTQLFSDYELLGFDPRGFGQSTNVQCLIDVDELNEIPVVADY